MHTSQLYFHCVRQCDPTSVEKKYVYKIFLRNLSTTAHGVANEE